MTVTLESLHSDMEGLLRGIDRIEKGQNDQNGRQRKNTETIIRLCAKMDAAEDNIDTHEKAIVKNADDIHKAEVKSVKGDRLVAIITAMLTAGGAAAYLVFGR